jgi:pSer/pThr/pTyr-binding forkhead associated (FHA) protein
MIGRSANLLKGQGFMLGELIPVGGGDPIPLLKQSLLVGRRESCDVVLRFGNVSGQHCQLTLESGYWFVQDLGSQNGTKVNGTRIMRKRLDPGDKLSVAKHTYEMSYNPVELGASGPPPSDDNDYDQIMGKSLLERAGLAKRTLGSASRRFNPNDNSAGQYKKNRDFE